MTHFLWVEDFKASETNREENIVSSTIRLVFGSILNDNELTERLEEEDAEDAREFLEEKGIFLKLNLLEALEFIHNPQKLATIDFVVLDVDMPLKRDGQEDKNNYLSPLITQYQSEDELKKTAGYQLYTELVIELGFPKQHILFCSNHAKYFEIIKKKFASANIKLPVSSDPAKPFLTKDDKANIEKWLRDAQNDYFMLRRGIIAGCKHLQTLTDKLRFDHYCKEDKTALDIKNYLETLEKFLPLRELNDKKTIFKLFIRTLAHEWEAAEPKPDKEHRELFAFSWIMKMSRNWSAHSQVFSQLIEQDVAYLFIVNMRAMFELGDELLPYEKHLLHLFEPMSADEMKKKIGNNPKKRGDNNPKGRDIPLIEHYAALLKKTGSTWEAINFHDALNDVQKKGLADSNFLLQGLYQVFWFLTSNGQISLPSEEKIKEFSVLNYQFRYFDYKTAYLFEIARHIYHRSFLSS